jgi:hypothetical protein
MASGVGTALSIGGSLLGSLGGNDTSSVPTQISGYDSYPDEVKKYLTESALPRIIGWGNTPYQTVPLRRTNESDTDPIFGSTSRQWLQEYYDKQRAAKGAEQPTGDTGAQDAAAMADMEARMIARQKLSAPNSLGVHTTQTSRNQQMLDGGRYNDDALAAIGRYYQAEARGLTPDDKNIYEQYLMAYNAPRRGTPYSAPQKAEIAHNTSMGSGSKSGAAFGNLDRAPKEIPDWLRATL